MNVEERNEPTSVGDNTPSQDVPATLAQTTEIGEGTTPHWSADLNVLPRKVGRYELQKQLGRGGMGTVFLAFDTVLKIPVALKVPHPEIACNSHALERFYREAQSAAQLTHTHICRVYDVGNASGHHYLAMAYVEGDALAALIPEYVEHPRRSAELILKVALAVQVAHDHKVVHRDLKPHNIMIDGHGEPVVMDFGLARQVATGDPTQTSEGAILGTPAYMPPEQATGEIDSIGPRSDVYSLGVVLYELITGRVPFEGPTMKVLFQAVHQEPPRPSAVREGIDADLEAICLRAIAKQPEDRYASMTEMAAALQDYLQGREIPAPPPPVSTDSSRRLVDAMLADLRQWGWEKGLENIHIWLPTAREVEAETAALLLGWLGGDREQRATALEQLRGAENLPLLDAWVLVVHAFVSLRTFQFARARREAEEASRGAAPSDPLLQAHLALLRGVLLDRQGGWDEAVAEFHQALGQFGRGHFMTGRVLHRLGRAYAGKCNFDAAREFFQQAIRWGKEAGDEPGLLLSYEEAGRLFLDLGQLDRADDLLLLGLRLAQRTGDRNGEASLCNHLGRVALARGEREAAAGKKSSARKHWAEAREFLTGSIGYNEKAGRGVQEGRARKDAALLCLQDGDVEGAEAHLHRAEQALRAVNFERGLAEVWRVRARLLRKQGNHEGALELLRQALAHYDSTRQRVDAALTQQEIAHTLAEAGVRGRLMVEAVHEALQRAENCRRGDLVSQLEDELKEADEEAHWRHVFRRVRGYGASERTASLSKGRSEPASVIFMNLHGFVPYCQGLDPEQVMVTLNHLLADMEEVLERHGAEVTAYLGGGFMALVREAGHAERAVNVALDLLAVCSEFNRPRLILGLRQLPVRIGVASGVVCLGNIGTYRKMDFTAVGPPVNLASRLMREADVTAPCISQETRELAGDRFVYREGSPRVVDLTGIGQRSVWDVIGRSGG
jgi:class 3 adenylate cyclase/tRNA A-37 threonylcarbamoyl transferase component Bud32